MKNSATGEMIEYKNTIIIAAIGTSLNITQLAAFIDLLICSYVIYRRRVSVFKTEPWIRLAYSVFKFWGGGQFEATMHAAYFRSDRG
jgi:hypothetical protein